MLDADPNALLLAPLALSLDNELGATYLKLYAALAPVAEERVLGLDDWPEMRPVVGGLAKPLDRACRAADERVRAICDEHAGAPRPRRLVRNRRASSSFRAA